MCVSRGEPKTGAKACSGGRLVVACGFVFQIAQGFTFTEDVLLVVADQLPGSTSMAEFGPGGRILNAVLRQQCLGCDEAAIAPWQHCILALGRACLASACILIFSLCYCFCTERCCRIKGSPNKHNPGSRPMGTGGWQSKLPQHL